MSIPQRPPSRFVYAVSLVQMLAILDYVYEKG